MTVELRDKRLVLASASERRKAILEAAGYRFDVIPANAPEVMDVKAGAIVSARRNALAKVRAVAATLQGAVTIGADTLVTYAGRIFGKPRDWEDACSILSTLSGTTHYVITAVALADSERGTEVLGEELTRVTMRHLSPEEVREYVKKGEGFGKAGAFAVQETADRFIERMEGDFSNVVGFPLALFERLLKELLEEIR